MDGILITVFFTVKISENNGFTIIFDTLVLVITILLIMEGGKWILNWKKAEVHISGKEGDN